MTSRCTKISPKSGRGLGHVTPTIFGSTVGYPSDSLASCINYELTLAGGNAGGYFLACVAVVNDCYNYGCVSSKINSRIDFVVSENSGVTTRGEVRQLPQGAKRQGALWVDGLFALLLNSKDRRTLTRSSSLKLLMPTPPTMEV